MEIEPYVGAGPLGLGMSRSEVRKVLGETPTVFRRTPDSEPTDFFSSLGIQASYDLEGRLEFIELTKEAAPIFGGVPLVDRPMNDVVADLESRGHEGIQEDAGWLFPDAGLSFYAPELTVEAVAVYRKGYYD